MKFNVKSVAAILVVASLSGTFAFAGAPPAGGQKHPASKTKKDPKPSVEDQIQALRQEFKSQIDSLKSDLAAKDAALQKAQQAASDAQAAATKAQAAADAEQQANSENTAAVSTLKSSVDDMKNANAAVVATMQEDQVKAVKKSELSDLAFGKVKIGATFYGDWAYYSQTGFAPQFLTQMNGEGPGNDGFNTFDITRTYLNVLYTPTDSITLRLTPNIYRAINTSAGALADGSGAQVGSSNNGNLSFRLKYAYLQFNRPFKGSSAFGKGNIRLGQTMNPLVDWEEGLYGYRFVNLTPWNYLSLSSTYVGAEVNGPIMVNGKEYIDYQIGAFNTASFHAIEQNDKKQIMGRVTFYPMGTHSDRTGLGFTIFENYGYNTKTPDTKSTPLNRLAILGHYQNAKKTVLIAGEYDLGRNAISTGQLFSGAAPTSTGSYAWLNSLAGALVGGDKTRQQGWAVFGHASLGKSPLAVFGMVHGFEPNTKIGPPNPLNFRRTVGGISYQYNKYLTFALDDQNFSYTTSQYSMTQAQIATFSSSLAAANPNGIANVVPNNTNVIMLNAQFSY